MLFRSPLLRMVDFADGYIWQAPVDEIRMVQLIPLEEYAAADAADAGNRAEWQKRASDLANPNQRASWAGLSEWRVKCGLPAPSGAAPK